MSRRGYVPEDEKQFCDNLYWASLSVFRTPASGSGKVCFSRGMNPKAHGLGVTAKERKGTIGGDSGRGLTERSVQHAIAAC